MSSMVGYLLSGQHGCNTHLLFHAVLFQKPITSLLTQFEHMHYWNNAATMMIIIYRPIARELSCKTIN